LLPEEHLQEAVHDTAACSTSSGGRGKTGAHTCTRQGCQWRSSGSACSSSSSIKHRGRSCVRASKQHPRRLQYSKVKCVTGNKWAHKEEKEREEQQEEEEKQGERKQDLEEKNKKKKRKKQTIQEERKKKKQDLDKKKKKQQKKKRKNQPWA